MRNVEIYVDLSSSDSGVTILDIDSLEFSCHSLKVDIDKKEHDKNQRALLKIRELDKQFDEVVHNKLIIHRFILESPFVNSKFLKSSEMVLKVHGFVLNKYKNYNFSFFTPAEIKKAITGRGNASKEDVIAAIKEKGFDLDIDGVSNDNVYDSFAILLTNYKDDKQITNSIKKVDKLL